MENKVKPCGLDSVFICYSTNSPTLYYDAGAVDNLCVTRDPSLAMEYVRDQLTKAYDSGYGVDDRYEDDCRLQKMVMNKPTDYKEFTEYINTSWFTLIVYRGGRDNSNDYYDIRVEKMPLLESYPNPFTHNVIR